MIRKRVLWILIYFTARNSILYTNAPLFKGTATDRVLRSND